MMSNKTKAFCRVAAFCLFLHSHDAYTLPKGMQVVSGSANVVSSSLQQQLQLSDKVILNWSEFSINPNELVQFLQPSSSSVVLNRVTGNLSSNVLGTLLANGQVFLINPQGIIFGKDSCVQVGSLIASTLDILDDAFLQGTDIVFSGEGQGSLVNLGTLKAPEGDVVLLGRSIVNEGTIQAAGSYMIAGGEILLKQSGSERVFIKLKDVSLDEKGTFDPTAIEQLQENLLAGGSSYQYAIKDSGRIEATGVLKKEGRIYLIADAGKIDLSGTYKADTLAAVAGEVYLREGAAIDVSRQKQKGNIQIISNAFYLDSQASLCANGGDLAGNISLISNAASAVYGNISATGNVSGGSISISSLDVMDIRSKIDLSGKKSNGTFSVNGKSIVINSEKVPQISCAESLEYSSLVGFPSKIQAQFVQNTLQKGNVKFTMDGMVTLQDDVTWDSPSSLSIEAAQILIGVEGSKNASLISKNAQEPRLAIQLTSPYIQIGAAERLKASSVQAKGGDITISANDLILHGGKNKSLTSFDSSAKILASNGNIKISSFADKGLQLQLQGGTGKLATAEILTTSGNISIGSSQEGLSDLLLLKGGSGENSSAVISSLEKGSISCLFPAASTVKLIGGSGHRSAYAMIAAGQRDGQGSVEIQAEKYQVFGGSGSDAGDVRAMIMASGGEEKIDLTIGKELIVKGGSAMGDLSDAQALIQAGDDAGITVTFTGNDEIEFSLLGGQGITSSAQIETSGDGQISLLSNAGIEKLNMTMQGGTGDTSSAEIKISGEGPLDIQLPMNSLVYLEAGTSQEDSSVKIYTSSGDMTFMGGSFFLKGGNGEGTNTVELCTERGNIFIDAGGAVQLEAGSSPLSSSAIYTSLGSVTLQAQGDISLKANDEASSLIVSNGEHTIRSEANIILSAEGKQKAYILNLSKEQGKGSLSLESKKGIELHGNSLLQNQAGDLKVVSGENLLMRRSRIESLGTGTITIIADHQYETTGIAKGGVLFHKASAIEGLGPVKIYTSERGLNAIDDVVNGVYFDPQRKYLNSRQERWGASYPNEFFGEQGFTIFYRENGICENGESSVLYLSSVLNDQLYYDLFTSYDDRYDLEEKFITRKKKVKTMYARKRHRWFYWKENLLPRRRSLL